MANITWIATLAGNASVGTNWSGGGAPAVGDVCIFDGVGGANGDCTWNITTAVNQIDLQSGYSGNFTATAALNVNNGTTPKIIFNSASTLDTNGQAVAIGSGGFDASGASIKTLTLGASIVTVTGGPTDMTGINMSLNANTSEWKLSGAGSTLDISTLVFNKLTFNHNDGTTVTITGTVSCTNDIDLSLNEANHIIDGGTLDAQGNVTRTNSGASNTSGTTLLKFTGSAEQTWSIASATGIVRLNIEIDKSLGTLTLSGVLNFYGNWTYTAGTVDAGTSELRLNPPGSPAAKTITDSTTNFYKVTCGGTVEPTITLSGNMKITNILDLATGNANWVFNGDKFMASGDVTISNSTGGRPTGTATLEFTGTANQTWDQVSTSTAYGYGIAIIVNKSGGTLTVSGTVNSFANFTYTAGTVSTTNSTFRKGGDTNLNSGTIAWNNVTIFSKASGASSLVTLTGNLDVNGTLTINSDQTLAGGANQINCAGNFTNNGTFTRNTSTVVFDGTSTVAGTTTFNNFTINSSATVSFTSTQTFTVAGLFTANSCTLNATTVGSRANLTVSGTQSTSNVTATDIDSSGGINIPNPGGSNNNTVNWGVAATTSVRKKTRMLVGVGL
jgi:hypothetical protein